MAYTEIDKPSDYFNTVLYSGDNSTGRSITGVGFAVDFLWLKDRTTAGSAHFLSDTVRGDGKWLRTNGTFAENTDTNVITSLDSDGFTVGNDVYSNKTGDNYVAWNWKESATAGFDIVSFTGSGSQRTVSHNLGVKPSMIIVKNRSATENWIVYDKINGAGNFMALNLTSATAASSSMFGVEPTSSVFTVGTSNATNKSSSNMIAYCFAEKTGYSKISSYVGNGSTDGTFIYTGFKPAFILIKNTNATQSWRLIDNKRFGYNVDNIQLYPNLTNAESTSETVADILSNGFKIRSTDAGVNGSGNTLIYMAFAESPFTTNTGIPTTAR